MPILRLALLAALAAPFGATPAAAPADGAKNREEAAATVQLYSAPDETSPLAGSLRVDESPKPIAESLGARGERWHLVKTPGGVVGWIKAGESEQSKKLGDFFKPDPLDRIPSLKTGAPPASSATLRGAIAVPVWFAGRAAVVSTLLNGSARADLIVDTGATTTVISRRLANLLNVIPSGTMIGQTVGGLIAAPTGQLTSLRVGEAEVAGLSVIIHDFLPHPKIEGLLGMDFLGRFQVGLDSQKQVLLLTPR